MSTLSSEPPLERVETQGREHLGVASTAWFVGAYCGLLGSVALVAPHRFESVAYVELQGHAGLLCGLLILGGGVLGLSAVLGLGGPWRLAAHLLPGMELLILPLAWFSWGRWESFALPILGIATLVSGLLPAPRAERPVRADLLTIAVAFTAVVVGGGMLLHAEASMQAAPTGGMVEVRLALGAASVLSGAMVIAGQLGPPSMRLLELPGRWLLVALLVVATLTIGIPQGAWFIVAYSACFGAVLALQPRLERILQLMRTSLRARMALAMAVTAVAPLIVAFTIIANASESSAREDALLRERNVAASAARELEQYVQLHVAGLKSLGHQPALFSAPSDAQRASLGSVLLAYPDFISIGLRDADNRRLTSVGHDPQFSTALDGRALSGQERIDAARAAPGVVTLYRSEGFGQPTLNALVPAFGPDGSFLGVIGGALPSAQFQRTAVERAAAVDGRRVFLLDTEGRVLAHSEPELVSGASDLSFHPAVQALQGGGPGTLTYGSGVRERIAAAIPLNSLGWTLVMERPTAVVLADAYRLRELALMLMWLSIVSSLVAGALFATRLSAALRALTLASQRLVEGDRSAPIPISSIADVSQLAGAFQTMRASLAERERELTRQYDFTRSVLETAPIAITVFDPVPWRFVLESPRLEHVVGYSGAALESLGTRAEELVHPQDQPALIAVRDRLASAPVGTTVELLVRIRQNDGSYRWIDTRSILLDRIVDGPPGQILSVATDVTDRKVAEEALLASETRFRSAVDASHALVYEVNLQTGELAAVHGLDRVTGFVPANAELTSEWWHDHIHPDDLARHMDELDELIALGDRDQSVYRVRDMDGAWRHVEDYRRVTRDSRGRAVKLVGAIVDITARKAAEAERERLLAQEQAAREEAEAALRARDEFLSIAAHELLTPITSLKGQVQLLQRAVTRGAPDAARLEQGLRSANDGADRLTALTRDLLDVARLRTGHMPLRPRPLDLAPLLRRLVEEWEPRLLAGQLLRLELDQATPGVDADPDRLEQVVTNLIGNAIKYSPDGGEIRIQLSALEGGVRVDVMDQGIGLPEGSLERIFQPFGRAANAELLAIQGMGLGLHICVQIMERHGGWLRATSEGEGRGSTFSLWLPRSAGSGSASDAANAEFQGSPEAEPGR